MDRKTVAIFALTISALVLLMACTFQSPAQAAQAVKDKDYQLVTVPVQAGGDALYVIDNRAGLMAVFSYDPNTRSLAPRAVRSLEDAFAAAGK